jgi:ubiquinone/menaquinone biosynthesis C-methylase UbiE
MTSPEAWGLLRCPKCASSLRFEEGPSGATLVCACGSLFPFRDGFPDLRHPESLLPSDEEFRTKYDEGAERYDAGLEWLFESFHEDEEAVRASMTDLLQLSPGDRALEIGCGTGKDSLHILRRLGDRGELWAAEISLGMLSLARDRIEASGGEARLLLCNGSYLPFPDRSFDAVFHFGGINTFAEIPRAFAEMTRVARIGAKVVVGDEGVPPWLKDEPFGRILANANPLYLHEPPLAALPVDAREVSLRWILGTAFYLVDYRVGEGPPPLDIDLRIPGKGDTLRSRFEGKKKG